MKYDHMFDEDESALAASHRMEERSARVGVWCERARRALPWIATTAFVCVALYAFTSALGGAR
jgi:hypothetical protein